MKFFFLLISVILTALSFYCCDYFVLFSLLPFFFILNSTKKKLKRFMFGYLWGIIFFSFLCYWLRYVSISGLTILVIYLALYPALFSFFLFIPQRKFNPWYCSSLWVVLDFLRSFLFTGFPWGYLGYALSKRGVFIQIADIFGVYGITFLIVFSNGVIFYLLTREKTKRKLMHLFILGVLILGSFFYGKIRLGLLSDFSTVKNIALIQTNIDSDLKWDTDFYEQSFTNFRYLVQIARYKGAELIILPETILPLIWERDFGMMEEVKEVIRKNSKPVLLGLPYWENDSYYNASLFFNQKAEIENRYFKTHLVPFGEYLPWEGLFSWVKGIYPIGFYTPGKVVNLFKFSKYAFGVLICYEDIFPELVRKRTLTGAEFLVNQSDEGWFEKSKEIYLNTQIAVFRAIENRRSILRATNTGFTSIINYRGEIIKSLEPFKAEVLIGDIPVYSGISFYTKFGWLFPGLILIVIICYWIKDYR